MLRRAITSLTILALAFVVLFPDSMATAANQASGLKISPVRTELTIAAGQSKTVPVYITDPTNSPIELQVFVNDFTANGDNGSPELILNAPANYPHGLAGFIAPIKNVSLLPNQQATVNVVITIPKNTAGGGYYAAVRFSPVVSGSSQSLALTANVASLFLVTVPGPGLNAELNVSSFNVKSGASTRRLFFSRSGLSAEVKFTNPGNVQEAPFGKVVVQSGSKTILTQTINNSVSPGSVLPGSSRVFSVPLSNFGWFGKYKISGYFGYGSSGSLLSVSKTIYVIDSRVLIVAGAIILVIITLIVVTRRQLHKRHKLNQTNTVNNLIKE